MGLGGRSFEAALLGEPVDITPGILRTKGVEVCWLDGTVCVVLCW